MKRSSRAQIAKQFLALYKESKPEAIQQLAKHIVQEHRTNEIDLILHEIERSRLHQDGYLEIELITARPIDKELLHQVGKVFRNLTQATNVHINEVIQKNIIGGFIARSSEYEIDASLHRNLSTWRSHV